MDPLHSEVGLFVFETHSTHPLIPLHPQSSSVLPRTDFDNWQQPNGPSYMAPKT